MNIRNNSGLGTSTLTGGEANQESKVGLGSLGFTPYLEDHGIDFYGLVQVYKVGSRLPDGTQLTKWMRDESGYSSEGTSEVASQERVNHSKEFRHHPSATWTTFADLMRLARWLQQNLQLPMRSMSILGISWILSTSVSSANTKATTIWMMNYTFWIMGNQSMSSLPLWTGVHVTLVCLPGI